MKMTGESDFEDYAWGGLSAERRDRYGGNFSIPEFKPWGSQGGVAAVSIMFTVWIVLANGLLLAVVLNSRVLRKQRVTPFIIQMALADLAVGVFYCPLSADFYIKKVWTHGCDSLFIWNNFMFYTTFLSVHCIGLIDLYRLLGNCCHVRLSWKLKLAITIALFILLWGYLVMFSASLLNFRVPEAVTVFPNLLCHVYIGTPGSLIASMFAYFAPATVTIVIMIIIVVREKVLPPLHQELDRVENKIINFKVLVLANAVTLGMCLPSFLINVSVSCGSLNCIHWTLLVTTIFEWILFAKSAVQPIIWLLNPQYKTAILPVVRFIRRQPGTDSTELVEADDSQESDPRMDASDNVIA